VLLPSALRHVLPLEHVWYHREVGPPYDSTSGRQLFRADHPSMTLVPMTSNLMTSNPLATFHHCDHRVPGSSLDHRNCETRNTFATTNCAKPFGTISLHRDRSADCARKSLRHFLATCSQLWALAHHSGIDIAWFKA
jgi:hypothetical protein